MILTINELKTYVDCGTMTDSHIKMLLDSIESAIRSYTNNKFQNRSVRFIGKSDASIISGKIQYFKECDTVEISGGTVNDGLYIFTSVTPHEMTVDRDLFDAERMTITKIVYPPDVKRCALDLFSWKITNGQKVGIKSETLSRHSVTYEDSASLYMGYPIGILNGLHLYRKVRF